VSGESNLLLRLVAIFLLSLLRRFRLLDRYAAGFVTVRQVRLTEILHAHYINLVSPTAL